MSGMKSWSTTPANNVLANTGFTMDEGQAPSTLNDSIRQAMADIRTEWAQGANIASAATVDLSAATGGYVHITGAVTITSFGTVSAGIRRKITFDGALTLTHNATSLILPTGASIVTVAGDTCEAMSEGSGNWRVLWYAGKDVQATTVTASTSVVTPLVQTTNGGSLILETTANQSILIKTNGVNRTWTDSGGHYPDADNTFPNGKAVNRWSAVFTPIIDTGTTGSGALKTNNGTTVLTWANDLSTTLAGVLRGPATMMAPIANSLGADVLLNNTANYFDGPSIAQGISGTWFVSGSITVTDAAGAVFNAKLWDGTTIISSTVIQAAGGLVEVISLSGFITTPAANLRISAKDTSSVNGKILFNTSGNSKDSTITAIRIA